MPPECSLSTSGRRPVDEPLTSILIGVGLRVPSGDRDIEGACGGNNPKPSLWYFVSFFIPFTCCNSGLGSGKFSSALSVSLPLAASEPHIRLYNKLQDSSIELFTHVYWILIEVDFYLFSHQL